MHYALLLYENETIYDGDDEAMEAIINDHIAFSERHAGVITGGAGLQTTPTATTLRKAGGSYSLHDGPFAETKEQLGGIYFVEAADLDAAIALARQIPFADDGAVEIRPLLPMPNDPRTA